MSASPWQTGRVLAQDQSVWQVLVADELHPVPMTLPGAEDWEPGDLVRWNTTAGHRLFRPATFDASGDALRWRRPAQSPSRMQRLRQRQHLQMRLRNWFVAEGFLEIEAPLLVPAPSPEVQFDPVSTDSGFLITSPEFQMKRLLVGGFEQIFALVPCFRGKEISPRHNPEFTMLEWYRANAPLEAITTDLERLLTVLLEDFPESDPALKALDWTHPWPRVTVSAVFREQLHVELEPPGGPLLEAASLRAAAEAAGHGSGLEGAETYEEVFFRLWDQIEPQLGRQAPVFVHDWPLPLASLAQPCPEHPGFADRVELYLNGLELGNGFGELTDPDEQRRRFMQDLRNREHAGQPEVPLDEAFLQALAQGLPPSAGMAVGFDRLVMLITGASSIREVLAFEWTER